MNDSAVCMFAATAASAGLYGDGQDNPLCRRSSDRRGSVRSGTITWAATALVPADQSAGFTPETLESLSAQTYPNFEALISVDVCNDGTYVIKGLDLRPLKILHSIRWTRF